MKKVIDVILTEADAKFAHLSANDFGLPAYRKFPMTDATGVRMTMVHFGNCKEGNKRTLAKNIVKKAKEFGVDIKNKEILKYAGVTEEDTKKVPVKATDKKVIPAEKSSLVKVDQNSMSNIAKWKSHKFDPDWEFSHSKGISTIVGEDNGEFFFRTVDSNGDSNLTLDYKKFKNINDMTKEINIPSEIIRDITPKSSKASDIKTIKTEINKLKTPAKEPIKTKPVAKEIPKKTGEVPKETADDKKKKEFRAKFEKEFTGEGIYRRFALKHTDQEYLDTIHELASDILGKDFIVGGIDKNGYTIQFVAYDKKNDKKLWFKQSLLDGSNSIGSANVLLRVDNHNYDSNSNDEAEMYVKNGRYIPYGGDEGEYTINHDNTLQRYSECVKKLFDQYKEKYSPSSSKPSPKKSPDEERMDKLSKELSKVTFGKLKPVRTTSQNVYFVEGKSTTMDFAQDDHYNILNVLRKAGLKIGETTEKPMKDKADNEKMSTEIIIDKTKYWLTTAIDKSGKCDISIH